jgi:hypothetical protein
MRSMRKDTPPEGQSVKIKYTEVHIWQGIAVLVFFTIAMAMLAFSLGVSPQMFQLGGIPLGVGIGLLLGNYVGIK